MQRCEASPRLPDTETLDAEGPVGPHPVGPVRLAAVGLSLIAVCYGLARFAYGLFVPTFRSEFGLDAAAAGAVASGSYLGYCAAVVLATVATARWGARATAVAAGGCATAGTALIAAAPSTPVLVCGVVLAGSSTGLASPPLADAVARSVPPRHEPRVQTVVNAGTGLGVLVAGPVALLLTGEWRWAWAVFSALAAAVTLWTACTIPARPANPPTPVDTVEATDSAAAPRSTGRRAQPGTTRLLTAAALMGFGSAAVWTFARDLVTAAGATELVSTLMWVALGAAGLIGAWAGDLAARVGLAASWAAGMLLLAAATALLAVDPASEPAAFAASAVFGAVYIALTGLLLLWGARTYPQHPVLGVGAAFLLIAVGQALGAPLLGRLADATSTVTAFLAAAAVITLGAGVRPRPALPSEPRGSGRMPRPGDAVVGGPPDGPSTEKSYLRAEQRGTLRRRWGHGRRHRIESALSLDRTAGSAA